VRWGRDLAERVLSMHQPSPHQQMAAAADYYRPSGSVFHGLICVCLLPNRHIISAGCCPVSERLAKQKFSTSGFPINPNEAEILFA